MSADILAAYAEEKWKNDDKLKKNLVLVKDLHAKATAYSALNKIAFACSVLLTISALMFPFLEILLTTKGLAENHSAFQTALTGLAAVSVALYNHYKKRQLYVENFMRQILYLEKIDEDAIKKILQEIEKLDAGFSFSSPSESPDPK